MQFREAVNAAIEILQNEAKTLWECSTINGQWLNELHAQSEYERLLCVVKALRDGVKEASLQDMHAATFDLPLTTPDRLPGVRLYAPVAPERPSWAKGYKLSCNQHPDAPHGFDRNASHNAGRYVCTCEGWAPDAKGEQ